MTSCIVLSDSHGNLSRLKNIDTVLGESDCIFHLGDTSVDGNFLARRYNKVFVLNGNCDPIKVGETEIVTQIEDVKILACHGHRYGVKQGLDKLVERAKQLDCTLVLYGHTHCADICETDGITLINPGNMSRYTANSYCYLAIHGKKTVAKIVWLH